MPPDKEASLVMAWLEKKEPAFRKEINEVRKLILNAAPAIKERIKWNAPSYYTSADILTFGPYRNNCILLVFHHPAIVKIKSPLLEGTYKDRRLLYLDGQKDAAKKAKELTKIIRQLTEAVEAG